MGDFKLNKKRLKIITLIIIGVAGLKLDICFS